MIADLTFHPFNDVRDFYKIILILKRNPKVHGFMDIFRNTKSRKITCSDKILEQHLLIRSFFFVTKKRKVKRFFLNQNAEKIANVNLLFFFEGPITIFRLSYLKYFTHS